jgi:hypothetical protein
LETAFFVSLRALVRGGMMMKKLAFDGTKKRPYDKKSYNSIKTPLFGDFLFIKESIFSTTR